MTPIFKTRFIKEPKNVGSWVICEGFNVYVTKKPCWIHRKLSKLMLGWEWVDGKA